MKKKIAIHGFYGMGNLGDEAILKALRNFFNRRFSLNTIVFSRNSKAVLKYHGIKSIQESGALGYPRRLFEIKTCSLFCLGGGGILKDYGHDSSSLQKWLQLLRLAIKLKIKTSLCAIGVENIRYKRSLNLLRETINKVNIITVRDLYSKNLLQDIGVVKPIIVISDPGILLTKPKERKLNNISVKNRIMICLRHWHAMGNYVEDESANKNFIEEMAAALDQLVDQFSFFIDFVPFRTASYDDDRIFAKLIATKMKNRDKVYLFNKSPDILDFIKMLNDYILVIGMRLHSLIFASSSGLPIIALEYMPKIKAFMRSIDQKNYSINLKSFKSDHFLSLIENSFINYDIRSNTICSRITQLQKITIEGLSKIAQFA